MAQSNTISITLSITAPGHHLDDNVLPLEIQPDLSIRELKNSVSSGTGLSTESLRFFLNGAPLNVDELTVREVGIKDGEMLALLVQKPGATQSQAANRGGRAPATAMNRRQPAGPNMQDVETTRLQLLGDPASLYQLREQRPALASAVHDSDQFRAEWNAMQRAQLDRERERQEQVELYNRDPFNVEAQRKIEEMIRQDRVMENLQDAYENNPEIFGRVSMLYINAEVNGYPIKAFVDSGAQVTIMSPTCAEACGIHRLIDERYAGVARGVGTAKIIGRVHKAKIVIGGAEMFCSFTVMEGKDVDLLFGLDMLKRHRARIDLDKNQLVLYGSEPVPFLGEAEIPKQHEEAALQEPTLAGPNNTEIGAKSGAVQPAGTSAAASSGSSQAGPSSAQNHFQSQGRALGGTQSQPSQDQRKPFPQQDIDQLVNLGFTKQEAEEALRATDGNVEYAAGLLFSK